jgi:hypothetical protein
MNAPQKIVAKSKLSEWRGLDRIAEVVHGMRCIWREQEKDDIGVDGEIELCRPRTDGDGLIGTGKIVKVQSKSGSSYVIKDTDETFASPVTEKDLRYWGDLNVPIIYVVFHPDDDRLYWKDVKAYLAARPDALSAPFRIEFDKQADGFDEGAYPMLCALCEQAPERVVTDAGERLFTNLLPVRRMPEQIWVAPVLPEKQPRFHDRLGGGGPIPPYAYKAGMVAMLTDPTAFDSALTPVIDSGAVEAFELEDWLSQAEENENDLRTLLNGLLHRNLRRLGLEFIKDPRRYFFNKGLAPDAPLSRRWTNPRTGKSYSRLVAKHYSYGKVSFYRHLALDARFERFGPSWAIGLYPALHFTTDGARTWEGEIARSYLIRARAEEYNNVFLNNVLFWTSQLARGQAAFGLETLDETVMEVEGLPLAVDAGFSIRTQAPAERRRG